MAKLPQISGKDTIKSLARIGYYFVNQKGSHIRLHHKSKKPITVPNHRVLDKGLLRKILSDAELSVEEFLKLL